MTRTFAARLFFILLSPAALATANDGKVVPTADALELTTAEQATVRELAEQALKAKGLVKGKVYLTRIEVFRDTSAKTNQRNALVTHYHYDGDLAILTSINLGRKQVTKVETIPHLPTSLAPEELAAAEKCARADPEVRKALARYPAPLEVDALVVHTVVPNAPTFHHRVVRLTFRQGREYLLYGPVVDVDLTTGTVRVERRDTTH
jgi:hypothetical protein